VLLYQLSYNGEDAYFNKKSEKIASVDALFSINFLPAIPRQLDGSTNRVDDKPVTAGDNW
jgi:hypothetical protein